MNAGIKINYFFIVTLLFLSVTNNIFPQDKSNRNAISYILNGGRLGDNLVSFCHAKGQALKNKAKFLYVPFPYSDQLMIHELEPRLFEKEKHRYSQVIVMNPGQQAIINNTNTLYLLPYCAEAPIELKDPHEAAKYEYSKVDWKNQDFLTEIRKLIKPRFVIPQPYLPQDRITVAVHVRLGGAFESDSYLDRKAPTVICKMPPISYFIEQLSWLSSFFKDQPMYAYIFTDDSNPTSIMKAIAQGVNKINIQYNCRRHDNHWANNVLEDLFNMTHFDCLIRSTSNFTFIASKLTDYKVVISALNAQWVDGQATIDQVAREGSLVDEVQ